MYKLQIYNTRVKDNFPPRDQIFAQKIPPQNKISLYIHINELIQ